jgi:predicted ATPase with chaperone activity
MVSMNDRSRRTVERADYSSGARGNSGDMAWNPPPLATLNDTGLSRQYIADMALKALYFQGEMHGHEIAEQLHLPFNGIVDEIMAMIKREQLVDISGQRGIGASGYQYGLTSKGMEYAIVATNRTHYLGAVPVPLRAYIDAMNAQAMRRVRISHDDLAAAMGDLVVSKDMLDRVGPAANAGTSIFMYGPPGNGKTLISERIGRLIGGGDIWIPYAIDVEGQIIQLYDMVNHELASDQFAPRYGTGQVADPRWVKIKRPIVIVGGELTMEGLDLTYNPNNRFYEAPYQVKANGGLFLIDDFGRQQVSPIALLNRWIVPLEKRFDYLTLNNGRKIELPFNVLIVFSTNMDPADLVDDAFLRRIRYKIEVGNPTLEQYRDLFQRTCAERRIPYDESGLVYLIKEWYQRRGRELRFVHPRDIVSHLIEIATYLGEEPLLSRELLDRAAESYFVDL